MSLFEPAEVPCPSCGSVVEFDLSNSVNADRRPDLRIDILVGTFQHAPCGKCGVAVALPPTLTYLDVGRKQWILVKPAAEYANWMQLEAIARQTFALGFGAGSPRAAQAIGRALRPRIVFGWPALREKLLVVNDGIDDVRLELLKLAMLREVSGAPLNDESELRLVDVTDDALTFAWLISETEQEISDITLDRAALDGIDIDNSAWAPLKERLTDALFVDFGRLLLEQA